jgi:hypothetical protein
MTRKPYKRLLFDNVEFFSEIDKQVFQWWVEKFKSTKVFLLADSAVSFEINANSIRRKTFVDLMGLFMRYALNFKQLVQIVAPEDIKWACDLNPTWKTLLNSEFVPKNHDEMNLYIDKTINEKARQFNSTAPYKIDYNEFAKPGSFILEVGNIGYTGAEDDGAFFKWIELLPGVTGFHGVSWHQLLYIREDQEDFTELQAFLRRYGFPQDLHINHRK